MGYQGTLVLKPFTVVALLGMLISVEVECNEDFRNLKVRLDYLEEEILDVRNYASRIETRMLNKVDVTKVSITAELKQHMKNIMTEAIAEALQGASIEEMVRRQVVTEVRELKQEHQEMKRNLRHVTTPFRHLHKNRTDEKSFMKNGGNTSELTFCPLLDLNIQWRQKELETCNKTTLQKDKEIINLQQVLLNRTREMDSQIGNISSTTFKHVPKVSSVGSSSLPSSATIIKPEDNRTQILIVPLWSDTQHQFRQLDVHNNSVVRNQYLNLKHVSSMVYISKLRSLLMSLYNPNKIVTFNVNNSDIKTVRVNVESYGMTVDEEKDVVFMTTNYPRYTISRMNTKGKHFTAVIDMGRLARRLSAIDVNPKEEMVYVCSGNEVLRMTYYGREVQTLATGTSIYALVLANTGNTLYYNNENKLMKMSLNTYSSTELVTLPAVPWNLRFYNNTIYYSSWSLAYVNTGTIGAVDLKYNIVQYKLHTLRLSRIRGINICMIH